MDSGRWADWITHIYQEFEGNPKSHQKDADLAKFGNDLKTEGADAYT